jgi:HSP20 family protein
MTKEISTQPSNNPPIESRTFVPPVDIIETKDEFLLIADVPGASHGSIDVQYERGTLTLSARVTPRGDDETRQYHLREYRVGDYSRTFEVGIGIDAAGIQATVMQGVLTLHLPKSSAAKSRKVLVKGA